MCNNKQMIQSVLSKSVGLGKYQCDDDLRVEESLNKKIGGIEIRSTWTTFSRHQTTCHSICGGFKAHCKFFVTSSIERWESMYMPLEFNHIDFAWTKRVQQE